MPVDSTEFLPGRCTRLPLNTTGINYVRKPGIFRLMPVDPTSILHGTVSPPAG